MKPWLENRLLGFCEATLAAVPSRRPTAEQLADARIVAHRGARDGARARENTLPAFDTAVAAGVGAIEFDIRYTRDDEPVVHHDETLARVWGDRRAIADLSWAELRASVPGVPHLDELLTRYARRAVLMIELKTRGSARAERRLHERLADLVPTRDYYFLSMTTALFDACRDITPAARIVVAKLNWRPMRDWVRQHPCGGIAGPFVLMRRPEIARLRAGQAFVGSGFLTRRGLLMREIARGVPWIFTNQPISLQHMLDTARARGHDQSSERAGR